MKGGREWSDSLTVILIEIHHGRTHRETDLGRIRHLASQASHPLREKALASSWKQTAVIQGLQSRQSLHPVWVDFDSRLTTPCLSNFG